DECWSLVVVLPPFGWNSKNFLDFPCSEQNDWLEKLHHLFLKKEDESQDIVGFEFGQNRKNQYFGPSGDTEKFHEIPYSYHNKENLVNHVDNNYHYSSDCNLVLVHRQVGTVVDNHNHHVNHSHIICTSNSRTEVVEGGWNCLKYHRKNMHVDNK
nr:hypothetical protein [Tanacetum cinerariifolium]